ncbi:MAG: hypothetical protein JO266_21080, partial [Acidobacteria bacterium]|nr:hypothetical protein [Acidobacteriota bacterium]
DVVVQGFGEEQQLGTVMTGDMGHVVILTQHVLHWNPLRGSFHTVCLIYAVRPDGAYHQWRKDPSRELSIALVADERFGWARHCVRPRLYTRLIVVAAKWSVDKRQFWQHVGQCLLIPGLHRRSGVVYSSGIPALRSPAK